MQGGKVNLIRLNKWGVINKWKKKQKKMYTCISIKTILGTFRSLLL